MEIPTIHAPVREPYVTQAFGNKLYVEGQDVYAQWGYIGHNGMDFRAPVHTEVLACFDGEIEQTYTDHNGFGVYVRIRHSWGLSYYAHLSQKIANVGPVRTGEVIGLSGHSGYSLAPHLHFGIKLNDYRYPGFRSWFDPTFFLLPQEG